MKQGLPLTPSNISSLVIDSLCHELCDEDIAVAMFYCDFRDQQVQTSTNIIGAILRQLAVRGEILEHVRSAFQKAKMEVGGRGLRLPDMAQMLKQVVATLPQVFICIDALDECLPKHLLELLGSLRDILHESPRMRVFVTGRPQVEADITRYFATVAIVPISPSTHDIKRYLEKKLEMDTEPVAMSDSLRTDILRIIPRISKMCVGGATVPALLCLYIDSLLSDRFLLVSLAIDAILGEVTTSARRRKLSEVAKGDHLRDAYTTTLARIRAHRGSRSRLGMEALMWVSNSERPLHTSELCHALGVQVGSADLDHENVPQVRTILGSCLGLITVEASSSTFRLVHFTLQEHLSNHLSLFRSPHSMIAEVCLTYLNFRCVRELSPNIPSVPSTVPFVGYASCYWGKHLRREKTRSVSPLALQLLVGFEQHVSSQLLLLHYFSSGPWWDRRIYKRGGSTGFTGLHGAAFLGIVEIFAALLGMKEWDINAVDTVGRTALVWATVRSHEDMVKMLLQRKDVNPNTADTECSRTPLWWAAERGHEGIVKLLLEREDIDPNTADAEYGRTPLLWAAMGRHQGIVRLLLEREDINPNTADTFYDRTPLLWAAERGHEDVVKLLLEREDVNLGAADPGSGRTPLLWAVMGRHERIVKLLLERADINPNAADLEYGGTPLWWSARGGQEEVVRLLLEREDINPNTADTGSGRTPLLWAVMGGHERIVKLLLEREDINPNAVDFGYGRAPLSWASRGGHEGVVRLLLKRGDINPNTADNVPGRTPLLWAVMGRHERIVKLLLGREDINPNAADIQYSRTPLWWASRGGHEGVVKLLLEREDINPNAADSKYGRTPLGWAARGGNAGVVNLLLEREDIDPSAADTEYGRTPLTWSAKGGCEGIVKLLLERGGINPNAADTEYGLTPLWWAVAGGHEGVVELLLEQKDVSPNTADTRYGRTPLLWAAIGGHEGIIKLLLEREDLSHDISDLSGETALGLAESRGHAGVVRLLSEPKPSLALPLSTKKVPERRSPEAWACLSLLVPFLPDIRLLLRAALPFVIISSFAFLFYILALISPSIAARFTTITF